MDARSDLFSFGSVLYEMATGRIPFPGATISETIAHILHSPPEAVARFNYGVPTELEAIIIKSLEKDRDLRYQHASEMRTDLKRLKRDTGSGRGTGVSPSAGGALAAGATGQGRGQSAQAAGGAAALRWRALLCVLSGALTALLAVFLLPRFFPRQQGFDRANYRFTPLVTDGVSVDPAWSPDGKSVAYAAIVNGKGHMYVRSLSSPVPAEIKLKVVGRPAFWSPDSSRIFYQLGYSTDQAILLSVAVAGGEPQLVRQGLISSTLSPDGKTLADVRTEGGVTSIWILFATWRAAAQVLTLALRNERI